MRFEDDRPSFWLLNVGETHYPYALPDEPPDEWPRISGVHGVFRHLDDQRCGRQAERPGQLFNESKLLEAETPPIGSGALSGWGFGRAVRSVPRNTYVTVTADHGELFGEDGYFGHGPIQHEKVLEVPFIEGNCDDSRVHRPWSGIRVSGLIFNPFSIFAG